MRRDQRQGIRDTDPRRRQVKVSDLGGLVHGEVVVGSERRHPGNQLPASAPVTASSTLPQPHHDLRATRRPPDSPGPPARFWWSDPHGLPNRALTADSQVQTSLMWADWTCAASPPRAEAADRGLPRVRGLADADPPGGRGRAHLNPLPGPRRPAPAWLPADPPRQPVGVSGQHRPVRAGRHVPAAAVRHSAVVGRAHGVVRDDQLHRVRAAQHPWPGTRRTGPDGQRARGPSPVSWSHLF